MPSISPVATSLCFAHSCEVSILWKRPEGVFHALKRMKKEFYVLFHTLFGHEKLDDWSLLHGTQRKTECARRVL